MPELREHERLQLSAASRMPGRHAAGAPVPRPPRSLRGARRSPFLAAALALFAALGLTGCISIDLLGGGEHAPLEESVVLGRKGPKILLLEIDGVVDSVEAVPSLFGVGASNMVARTREVLDRAREDDQVRAVLLRIDSPGGTATASEQIHTEIVRFKRERGVPVVAQLLNTAASGGYYIAMAADTVQAHPTTVTGSIGVIYTSLNFAGLMEKLGIEDQTITGGEFKDVGSPFRRLTPEERAQLQSIVDDLHERFKQIVDEGRPELGREEVDALANGRIYSAVQARDNGLVDRLGTIEDAVGLIEDRLGVSRSRVVAYHRPSEVRRNLYTRGGSPAPRLARGGAMVGAFGAGSTWTRGLAALLQRPGFHYLWWPGLSAVGAAD